MLGSRLSSQQNKYTILTFPFIQKSKSLISSTQDTTLSTNSSDPMSLIISKLSLTYYKKANSEPKPALVYCHSFSGNKLEGQFLLQQALPYFTLFLFDFRGCGNSSEPFVTLGIREKIDLTFILRLVEAEINPSRIYLWGRSMGAATIIHYLHFHQKRKTKKNENKSNDTFAENQNNESSSHCSEDLMIFDKVSAVILDSPFHDCYSIVFDMMCKQKGIPSLIAKMLLIPIASSIKSDVKFDVLGENRPIEMVHLLKVPAFFMIGENDKMISQSKFKDMFALYGTNKKELRILEGIDHSSMRTDQNLKNALDFMLKIEFNKNPNLMKNIYQPLHCKNVLEKISNVHTRHSLTQINSNENIERRYSSIKINTKNEVEPNFEKENKISTELRSSKNIAKH